MRMWRKGTLEHCWRECKLVQPLWKTVWMLLKKIKHKTSIWSRIPLLDIYPKKAKTRTWKAMCSPMLTAALFAIAETWKQRWVSISGWMGQESVIHTHTQNTMLFTHKKNEILLYVTTWVDLKNFFMLSEISQEKDKCCMISLICGTSNNNSIKTNLIHRKKRSVVARSGGGGREKWWPLLAAVVFSLNKLTEWMNEF